MPYTVSRPARDWRLTVNQLNALEEKAAWVYADRIAWFLEGKADEELVSLAVDDIMRIDLDTLIGADWRGGF